MFLFTCSFQKVTQWLINLCLIVIIKNPVLVMIFNFMQQYRKLFPIKNMLPSIVSRKKQTSLPLDIRLSEAGIDSHRLGKTKLHTSPR